MSSASSCRTHHADLAAYDAKAALESLTAALSSGARTRADD
jgi:hypothetical protein